MPSRKHINFILDFAPVSEFQRQVWAGASRYCYEHSGYRCRTASTEANLMEDANVIDGVIAIVDRADLNHSSTRFHKPVVNVSNIAFPVPFPTIVIDNRAIGRLAAEHLKAQGYRFFAYHMESRVYFSSERYAGFSEALAESGHSSPFFDTAPHTHTPPRELHALTVEWLRQLPRPIGLFTHNDLRAAALLDLCRDEGFHVPQEIGIIGADNDGLIAESCRPTLSSVDTGAAIVGYRAAERMAGIIAGKPDDHRPIFLPPKGVAGRESTQPKHLVDDRLARAVQYIDANADKPISMSDLLEAVPASRRSLERLFREHLGRSPAEHIRRIQINQVKWLLMEDRLTLADIATKVGFSSFSNFASAFRREVGITPSAFRKRFRSAGVRIIRK